MQMYFNNGFIYFRKPFKQGVHIAQLVRALVL